MTEDYVDRMERLRVRSRYRPLVATAVSPSTWQGGAA